MKPLILAVGASILGSIFTIIVMSFIFRGPAHTAVLDSNPVHSGSVAANSSDEDPCHGIDQDIHDAFSKVGEPQVVCKSH